MEDKEEIVPILSRTERELKELAADLYNGKLFSDRHIPTEELGNMSMIFTPIALGAFKDWNADQMSNIGLMYEYLDKAAPRSINGFPIFFSFHLLNKSDTEKMFAYYEDYKKLQETFLTKEYGE